MRTSLKIAAQLLSFAPVLLILLPIAFALPVRADNSLKIGIIPYDAPSKLQEVYTPFANYLGTKVEKPAKVFVAQDYVGVVQALQADQIDCAYLNPLSYVLFASHMRNTPEHLIPISMPWVHGSLYYYGVILTRKETGITNIAQLKGHTIAFSEPTSTSGYLYPYQYLMQHGINPDKDFRQKLFAGTPAVIPAVLNGTVDAGAVFEEGIKMFAKPDQQADIVVLARVGPIANGMLVARGNLDPKELAQIVAAMKSINTEPAGIAANKALQVTKWEPANDSVFDPVRQAATVLGLKLESLNHK